MKNHFAGYFSSGPTRKFKGWNLNLLSDACVGRSHRSEIAKEKLKEVIERSRKLLKLPDDFKLAIVPGSATGAIETAMWNLLGSQSVVCHVIDVFSNLWAEDILELNLNASISNPDEWGDLPELTYNPEADLVITLNGTTSGVYYDDLSWIPSERENIVIADATSSAFVMPVDFEKVDAYCFSWQKGLGSEAAHGMLALSPRALEKIENYTPAWNIPRLFNLQRNEKVNWQLFEGMTTNTPSMLCVEDCLVSLKWAEALGGLDAMMMKAKDNLETLKKHVEAEDIFRFSSSNPSYASPCLIVKPFETREREEHFNILRQIAQKIAAQGLAFDIVNHAFAFPAFRLWCGPTTEKEDIDKLMPVLLQEIQHFI